MIIRSRRAESGSMTAATVPVGSGSRSVSRQARVAVAALSCADASRRTASMSSV